jgi:hypothetical protein
MKIREVTTILNAKGKMNSGFIATRTSFLFLEDVDLKLFDANGKLIERHRKKISIPIVREVAW